MRSGAVAAAVALAIAASGCAQPQQTDPLAVADQTTRAVYDMNLDLTTARFDDTLKAQATRASIGAMSDQMHALGTYRGLKAVSSDPDKGRYVYTAAFDKGTMVVQLRLDPNQKIGAFRVEPQPAR